MKKLASAAFALIVAATPSVAGNKDCSGAELWSRDTTMYGRWEVRMRAGAKSGTVSSFFLYYNASYEGKGQPWRELDIEVLGKNPKGLQTNPITGTAEKRITAEKFHETSDDLSKTFKTYVMEWTPDSIIWQLDGKTIRKMGIDSQTLELRTKPMSWRMNLWASAWPEWTGPFDTASLPTCQFINWIRFHKYTPGKGPKKSNWTEAWVDDFDSLNLARWGQGTWGFEGNYATFTPENMKTKRGMAVLALTRKGEEGIDCGYPRGMYPEDELGRDYPGPGKAGTLP